jgi:hypothetical protein
MRVVATLIAKLANAIAIERDPAGAHVNLRGADNVDVSCKTSRRFRYLALYFLATLFFFSPNLSSSAEDIRDLVRQGFRAFHQGIIEFDGCDYDKAYVVGPYIAICEEYGYSYSFGNVIIMATTVPYRGGQISLFYLCPEDDDECYQVTLRRR